MQVFKCYFKLAASMKGTLALFLGTFILASIVMMAQLPNNRTEFTVQKPKVAVSNNDTSKFSTGLTAYLADNTMVTRIDDTDTARKEAVYFQTVDAIYVIPAGFGNELFAGQKPAITTVKGSGQGAMQADTLVSNYLRLAEPRISAGMDQQDVVTGIKGDTANHIVVNTQVRANLNEVGKAMYFMNTLVYVILGLNIVVISSIMLLFNRPMIRRRNISSGVSSRSVTLQLFSANAVFSLGIWALFMIVASILYPNAMFTAYGMLYATGTLLFSLVGLSIGFAVGTLVSNRRVIPGITNVLALGMSFLCGVFVPQELLGDSVLAIAKLLPAYWFVHANADIVKLENFDGQSLQPIVHDWLILVCFALGILILSFIGARYLSRRPQS